MATAAAQSEAHSTRNADVVGSYLTGGELFLPFAFISLSPIITTPERKNAIAV